MKCCVIANYHPMIGVDFHDAYPAVTPLPKVPLLPHLVLALVRFGPWWMGSSSENETVNVPCGHAMAKIFDIGMFIPHIPLGPNSPPWILLYTLASSSQGHFGASSVKTTKGSIACALALFVNPQLHCESPIPPLPTGAVLAPSTVVAGMTLGDVIAGVLSMTLTSLATWGLGKAAEGIGKGIMNGLVRILPPNISLPATMIAAVLGQQFPKSSAVAGMAANQIIAWCLGSPMGYSFPFAPFGNLLGHAPLAPDGVGIQSVSESAGKAFDDANPLGMNDYFSAIPFLPP